MLRLSPSLLFLGVCLRVLCVLSLWSWLWLCVSVFLVVFGASAMKVNAWTCAPATASDLESALRSIRIRTRRRVNCAVEGQSQEKLWWCSGSDAQNVSYTCFFFGLKTNRTIRWLTPSAVSLRKDSNFWCVQSSITHTMWLYMCMCCGLFVPTQIPFRML